ncbi:Alpha/Beta hydrolase protein [Collybia nuda]|uniref:Alpha/Beta hydrolase protein n=1 Tax=Collybia nuda TaxID=64659 RepID=A0A9P6CHB5_9AGAR|nr:Alpha/Beta hydrolase protein [Collybia nuda]
MDTSCFKTVTTSRGFHYHYYHTPAEDLSLPILLFLHGFPATSRIWWRQVEFFRIHGFRLLVPDQLGFGKSSKPTDPEAYKPSLICSDIVEIMDAEGIDKAVAVGHGFGSNVVSRLANLYRSRFLGYAFLAVPYTPPSPVTDMQQTVISTRRGCGYEVCGHMLFFAESYSAKIVDSHMESFYGAMFPDDPKMWVSHVAPTGALQAWLEADKKTPPLACLTESDKEVWHDAFTVGGFEAPLAWHKAFVSGVNSTDDKSIPLDNYTIGQPVFFGAARFDYISHAVLGIAATNRHCKDASLREFNAGHWLILSNHTDVNRALLSWVMDIVVQ